MIWSSTRTWSYKKQKEGSWHLWFAWYPVVVEEHPDGSVDRAWLQTIKRKGQYVSSIYSGSGWTYLFAKR